ncbi:hypothetical protein ACOME3_001344 [Neoechinorhynchus agilis]
METSLGRSSQELELAADVLKVPHDNLIRMQEDFLDYSPSGRMTEKTLRDFLKHIDDYGIYGYHGKENRRRTLEIMFNCFDIDHEGSLDFSQFILGIVMLHSREDADPVEMLEYLIRFLDKKHAVQDKMDALQVMRVYKFLDKIYSTDYHDDLFDKMCKKGFPMNDVAVSETISLALNSKLGEKIGKRKRKLTSGESD